MEGFELTHHQHNHSKINNIISRFTLCREKTEKEKKTLFPQLKRSKGEDESMNEHEWMAYNRQVIEEFRAHGGEVQGWPPLILLITKGAKSSQTRIYPLIAVPDGDHYIAVASAGGAPKNPQWYHNLLVYPDV